MDKLHPLIEDICHLDVDMQSILKTDNGIDELGRAIESYSSVIDTHSRAINKAGDTLHTMFKLQNKIKELDGMIEHGEDACGCSGSVYSLQITTLLQIEFDVLTRVEASENIDPDIMRLVKLIRRKTKFSRRLNRLSPQRPILQRQIAVNGKRKRELLTVYDRACDKIRQAIMSKCNYDISAHVGFIATHGLWM
jgi:hypothetical protein